VTTSPSFLLQLQAKGIPVTETYRPLPVEAVVAAAEAMSDADVAATRRELTAGHPARPLLVYVGRWSAEKRLHLLKECRPEVWLGGCQSDCFIVVHRCTTSSV